MGHGSTVSSLLLRRIVGLVVTMFVASVAVFGALYLAPGDPAAFVAAGHDTDPSVVASIRAQYHLDDPLPLRYAHWVSGLVHGDLGQSIIFNEPVSHLLSSRIVTTALLVAYSLAILLILGISSGVVAGLGGRLADTTIGALSATAVAVPPFVTALVLITIFGVHLGWFPVVGSGTGVLSRLHHLTLPAISLALAQAAYLSQITRTTVREVSGSEYVDTARVRGLPARTYVRRHVLRNAMIPITTASSLVLAALIAGDAVIEQAFGLNGLGSYLIASVTQKDFPVVQAICLILVCFFVVVNTIMDLVHLMLDPRRSQARTANA
jgi:peptide/nickel transport system permease protein